MVNNVTYKVSGRELIVADFETFTLFFDFLSSDFATHRRPRLRLLPPYVEHLSQAFARQSLMRVGAHSRPSLDMPLYSKGGVKGGPEPHDRARPPGSAGRPFRPPSTVRGR